MIEEIYNEEIFITAVKCLDVCIEKLQLVFGLMWAIISGKEVGNSEWRHWQNEATDKMKPLLVLSDSRLHAPAQNIDIFCF